MAMSVLLTFKIQGRPKKRTIFERW